MKRLTGFGVFLGLVLSSGAFADKLIDYFPANTKSKRGRCEISSSLSKDEKNIILSIVLKTEAQKDYKFNQTFLKDAESKSGLWGSKKNLVQFDHKHLDDTVIAPISLWAPKAWDRLILEKDSEGNVVNVIARKWSNFDYYVKWELKYGANCGE